ncbi:MAG: alpha/beta fold hydrolase [Streptosporangiaceae bacterium]
MSNPATAVFVHGGWHDGWSWHLVRELLDAQGVPSVALDLPMTTLDRDAAVLSAALAGIEGDAIVIAHSWGGSVATLGAIGAPNVRHLVYIAAVLTEAGHPSLSPPSPVPAQGRETLRPKVVIETDTTTIIDREVSLAAFYHDVEPSLARRAAARLRPFQKTGYAVIETDAVAAWRTIPTTYVVCAQDRLIHPDTQREMAAAAGAEVLEWPSSHSPFLSHPGLVADLVAGLARSAQG